jgi:hypothetical protein
MCLLPISKGYLHGHGLHSLLYMPCHNNSLLIPRRSLLHRQYGLHLRRVHTSQHMLHCETQSHGQHAAQRWQDVLCGVQETRDANDLLILGWVRHKLSLVDQRRRHMLHCVRRGLVSAHAGAAAVRTESNVVFERVLRRMSPIEDVRARGHDVVPAARGQSEAPSPEDTSLFVGHHEPI